MLPYLFVQDSASTVSTGNTILLPTIFANPVMRNECKFVLRIWHAPCCDRVGWDFCLPIRKTLILRSCSSLCVCEISISRNTHTWNKLLVMSDSLKYKFSSNTPYCYFTLLWTQVRIPLGSELTEYSRQILSFGPTWNLFVKVLFGFIII